MLHHCKHRQEFNLFFLRAIKILFAFKLVSVVERLSAQEIGSVNRVQVTAETASVYSILTCLERYEVIYANWSIILSHGQTALKEK